MTTQEAAALVEKYNQGKASAEEKALLERWYLLEGSQTIYSDTEEDLPTLKAELWQGTLERAGLEETPNNRRPMWRRYAVAASILLALSFGTYRYFHQEQTKQVAQTHDVTPGTNSATLTLSNGQQIVLNSKPKGQIAMQGQVAINKTANGQLQYSGNATEALYNTITTKRKEQYDVVLADGTHVWLNAESSLKYPASFNGPERKVELTGEAYFEVAHNKAKPFRVLSKGQTVEVLGTHFDVNSYSNEAATRTTLLEGSVKVIANHSEQFIKPGQQSIFNAEGLTVKTADTELETAWHNGDFVFKGENIQTIMRQLARWYDIDVTYEGKPSSEGFQVAISRFKNISQVLASLESTKGVRFKVEGRSVTVMQ
ncbi:FecR family protein [Mucilaginibacter paludis]|uniref:Anti-FecI sigma factor, FecR n=1 Tax=Mucilaginibacter paludis DSM 18603 TaxID=714943 RepID=H1Y3F9_9SPHI|nr:FecR domain-containing protein [Mucilaginibacter paludis]EHQ29727.1 anti-FecI sigma factor, FecR [Mucilaginibacter paludis DSM 18603]